ncbi:MAG TPA: enoyl-CoA hydratase [Leucothrix mucor]|uniref:Enoyl-CoA hydratase n=1 Tax=Leucothrix mucor TaxID=45248 RepID=A0A7V2T0R7_LEUMU|nr:enoyl-CoA hydratase [Leucothrix mucor]
MSLSSSAYKELTIKCDVKTATIWVGMNPIGRQCFTLSMLIELHDLIHKLNKYGSLDPSNPDSIHHLVLESAHPEIYNSGGDLEYFSELVKQKDSDRLRDYGIICIDLIYWALTGGERQITTIAYVAGNALGGGFETALACHYIIAEKQSVFSFPESLFGFFPGMGAYELLERYSGSLEAERAFTTGKRYSAQELKLMGGIYSLVEKGQGTQAIEKLILEKEKNQNPHRALRLIKQRRQNISYESLEFSIDLWVETAMKLTEKQLRMMAILTRRQKKKGSVNTYKNKEAYPDKSKLEPLKIVATG